MQCPVCEGVNLVMSERSGIEIDYCPKCRGVWLDRGELDKIIERAAPAVLASPAEQGSEARQHPFSQQQYPQGHGQQGHADPYYQQSGYYKKKKREGFLGELFDFD